MGLEAFLVAYVASGKPKPIIKPMRPQPGLVGGQLDHATDPERASIGRPQLPAIPRASVHQEADALEIEDAKPEHITAGCNVLLHAMLERAGVHPAAG